MSSCVSDDQSHRRENETTASSASYNNRRFEGRLASTPGPHRHRIYEALPDGRRSGGDEGLGSRLKGGREAVSTDPSVETVLVFLFFSPGTENQCVRRTRNREINHCALININLLLPLPSHKKNRVRLMRLSAMMICCFLYKSGNGTGMLFHE